MLICLENSEINNMSHVDAEWIRTRLSGKRGERARLAEAMGIDNDKMSRIMQGKRRVQPEEIPKVLEFFGETLTGEHDRAKRKAIQKLTKLSPEKLAEAVRYLEFLEGQSGKTDQDS
jgi:transcriptional regulator with XRE-family HTH domain